MTTTASNESHAYSNLKKPDTRSGTFINPDMAEFLDKEWLADFRHLNQYKWWRYMDDMNNGFCNGVWRNDEYYTTLRNYDFMAAFSNDLDLTRSEYRRAQAYFSALELEKFGVAKEYAAHALCSYVIEMDERDQRRGHPQAKDRDDALIKLQAAIGLRESQLLSLYGKIAHHFRRNTVDEVSGFQQLSDMLKAGGNGGYPPDSAGEAIRVQSDW